MPIVQPHKQRKLNALVVKNPAKRITICAASFPPEKGGAPTRVYNMARLLQQAGYRVTVITAMPNYPLGSIFPGYRGRLILREVVDEINVVRLWLIPSNSGNMLVRGLSLISHLSTLWFMAFPRLLFGHSAAVIISSPPLITAWATAIMARMSGKKVVVNISDIWPLTVTEMGKLNGGFLLRTLQKMERQLYRLAGAYTGQSQEILDHIAANASSRERPFLYRNLQPSATEPLINETSYQAIKQIIYAGNLGHAQGILALCQKVNFATAGLRLHIYGDGAERTLLQDYLKAHPLRGVVLHQTITQTELNQRLKDFSAVLIPLKTTIHGAVPSKLFMAVANGLPVLFCGGGEGERLVKQHQLGWVSAAGDYNALQQNLTALAALKPEEEHALRLRIATVRESVFSKEVQDAAFLEFMNDVIG